MNTRSFTYIAQLKQYLKIAARKDTTAVPDGWTPENPLWGHCAVASAIAQKIYGGELLRYDLTGTKYAFMGSHYNNRLPDGRVIDMTDSQFGGDHVWQDIEPVVRERSYVLNAEKFPQAVARYKLLYWRLMGVRYPDDPRLKDSVYRECFFAALDSNCPKMHFGCVFMHDGKIVHVDTNKKVPALAHRCEPTCCREGLVSRTEPMLGACQHAEEGLWDVANMGIKPNEVEMYVAGFHPDMMPWSNKRAETTCIRCASQMARAKVKMLFVPVRGRWERVDPSAMLDTAYAYAVGERRV